MIRTRFVGTGAALPAQVVANAEIEDRLGLDRGWIARTGVYERRVIGDADSLVDLAEHAAREALAAADMPPRHLDTVVVATTSAPYQFPSLACLLHARLGLRFVPAFDVAAACAGFPYALTVADQAIRAGDHRHALVVGADCLTRLVDPADRATATLFGDGAGAVVVTGEEARGASPRGILASRLRALGELWPILYVRAGARRHEDLDAEGADPWMRMQGAEVFRVAVEHLVDLTRAVLAAADLTPADVALLVPHQANVRIVRMMLQLLAIPEERAAINLARYGNTSAASIPIALAEAVRGGRLAAGDVMLLNGVGGGVTAGAVVARW